ncbi:MAG TPA: lytic murein transglycosylase B [Xanthomonadales bacterium]|nr:lytic murein transglycosylase B [Xanthomonadales bacterium]
MITLLSRIGLIALVLACGACASDSLAKARPEAHPGQRDFVRELVADAKAAKIDIDRRDVEQALTQARFQQSIIDAMSRPAEKTKPWRDYRPIFMTDKRIADGVAFYRENAALLEPIAKQYGVPPEIIVAIIGVETNYGRITGKYKVLDALVTLAFYYPPRAEFFRGELKQLFLLPAHTLPYRADELVGSYAGAMGWGQFMPTSIAKWARSGDEDASIDLWASKADIFASIANYFVEHGWETGEPVASPAQRAPDARTITPQGYEPVYSLGQLADWGYRTADESNPQKPATLLKLDGAAGDEFWITHQNFWVITRYNRSPLYSMAVYQLAQSIAAGASAGDRAAAAR